VRPAIPRGRLSPGLAIALAVVAFVLAAIWMRSCWTGPWSNNGNTLFLPGFGLYGPLSLWGLLQAALAVWVGLDANKRGLNGVLWGLLVFFTGIVGLIVYLLVGPVMQMQRGDPDRPPIPPPATTSEPHRCPACRADVNTDFKICPYCGTSLQCGQCGKRVVAEWKVCPYCTHPLNEKS
jgi:RNA polymerase subunit RPABC4/transcription elongation factor Spt4